MSDVKFKDYSLIVKDRLHDISLQWLEEAGGELQDQAKMNTAVVTGKTKGSFKHKVNEGNMECHIGSDYENAVWEEFGTGIYALKGDGRKKPWIWYDEDGKGHYTRGKRPKRMLFNAYNTLKKALIELARERFGDL